MATEDGQMPALDARQTALDRAERMVAALMFRKYHVLDKVRVALPNFHADGRILDIGGGGEGVIGQLKGSAVTAIDLHQSELDEAPGGFEKLVMDARELSFGDASFGAVTAFFSFMYMAARDDHERAAAEAARVLKPGCPFLLWDVDTARARASGKEGYLARVEYLIGARRKSTGYGAKRQSEERNMDYYKAIFAQAGLEPGQSSLAGGYIYIKFIKRA